MHCLLQLQELKMRGDNIASDLITALILSLSYGCSTAAVTFFHQPACLQRICANWCVHSYYACVLILLNKHWLRYEWKQLMGGGIAPGAAKVIGPENCDRVVATSKGKHSSNNWVNTSGIAWLQIFRQDDLRPAEAQWAYAYFSSGSMVWHTHT